MSPVVQASDRSPGPTQAHKQAWGHWLSVCTLVAAASHPRHTYSSGGLDRSLAAACKCKLEGLTWSAGTTVGVQLWESKLVFYTHIATGTLAGGWCQFQALAEGGGARDG